MLQTHTYKDHNTQALWDSMGASDREAFNFYPSQIDWDEYHCTMSRGVRLYYYGDDLDTIPRAVIRMTRQVNMSPNTKLKLNI